MAVRYVYLTLGEREWRLRFAMSAWAALEDHGLSINAFLESLRATPPSMKNLGLGLWAMLQDEDEPPTLKDVYRMVDPVAMPDLLGKMGEAIAAAFPQPKENGSSPPRNGRGTGKRPSASPTAASA